MLKRIRPPTLKLRMPQRTLQIIWMASNHCKIKISAYISCLIASSGQFNGDKTKYSAASPNLQALHKRGESDIFNQRLLYRETVWSTPLQWRANAQGHNWLAPHLSERRLAQRVPLSRDRP
jgi:hypothetical protein